MIGKTIGNLKIISEIGKGGMGIVYLAEHVALKKHFAVKCLVPELTRAPQFSERFQQEARSQARLDHPNIVQVTDFFEQDNFFFLVMEYVDGQSLEDIIKNKDSYSEAELLSIFKDILNGLNFAHSKGLIHRDIKPSNILIDKNNRARITDFGIAILAGEKRLTKTGTNIGTAWYMSPEQIKHPKNIDHRSDVYAVGIILYEMLTGNVPYDGETDYNIKEKHCHTPIPDPGLTNSKISKSLSEIILKALAKTPDKRFSGCGEFLNYIESYETDPPPAPPLSKPNKMKKFVWPGLTLGLIILFSVLFMIYLPPDKPVTVKEINSILEVNTIPDNSQVLINNEYKGNSPIKLSLPSGDYTVAIKNQGYQTREEKVSLTENKSTELNINLKKALASFIFRSQPSNASIYLNGKNIGTTPETISNMEPGKYDIKLKLKGYTTWSKELNLNADTEEIITAELDASLSSLHISSIPSSAEIFVNEKQMGKTPKSISGLKQGNYNIELKLEGYELWKNSVHLDPGINDSLSATLTKMFSLINITSEPSKAEIYLNGDFKGKTPEKISDIEPGRYNIELILNGYNKLVKKIIVEPNMENFVNIKLKPLSSNENDKYSMKMIKEPIDNVFRAWELMNLDLYMKQWALDAEQSFNNKRRKYNEIRKKREMDFTNFKKVIVSSYNLDIVKTGENFAEVAVVYSMTFIRKNGRRFSENQVKERYFLVYDNLMKRWIIKKNFDYVVEG